MLNVTRSETYDDVFLSGSSNFQQRTLRLGSGLSERRSDGKLLRSVFSLMNASFVEVKQTDFNSVMRLFYVKST